MAFFNNLKNAANAVGKSTKNVINTTATDSKEKSELSKIKKELASIEVDIENGYTHIGAKYVEYLIASGDAPCIDIEDTLKALEPKFQRKEELNANMIEIEKRKKDRTLLQEKSVVEGKVKEEIAKLDKALSMELITQEEHDAKAEKLRKRLENFEAIKKIEQKYELGIITAEEKDEEIESLL